MACGKKLLFTALIIIVCGGARAAGPPATEAPTPPRPAADFHLADFKGQVVLLDFWASWCAPCRKSQPWLNTMQRRYRTDGLQVITINLDKKPAAAAKMSRAFADSIVQYSDPHGTLAEKYELAGMPSSFLFDTKGQQLAAHVGFSEAKQEERENEIKRALGGSGMR